MLVNMQRANVESTEDMTDNEINFVFGRIDRREISM